MTNMTGTSTRKIGIAMRFVNRLFHSNSRVSSLGEPRRHRSVGVGAVTLWAVLTGVVVYAFAAIPAVREHAKLVVWLVMTVQPLLMFAWLRRRGTLHEDAAVETNDRSPLASRTADTLGPPKTVPPMASTRYRAAPSDLFAGWHQSADINASNTDGRRNSDAMQMNGHHDRSEGDDVATTGSVRRPVEDLVRQAWNDVDDSPTIQLNGDGDRLLAPALPSFFDRQTGAMMFDASAVTDKGRRHSNQDSALITSVLLGVADGVGGRAHGAQASQSALKSVVHSLSSNPDISLTEAVMISNEVVRRDLGDGRENTPATTLDLVYLDETGDLTGTHVGDSRVGILARNDQHLVWLTSDHSVGNTLVRSVGADRNVAPDVWMHEVEAGDLVIMATDGLWKTPQGFAAIEHELVRFRRREPKHIARALVAAAVHAGASDNVTVVVGRVIQR